MLPKLLLLLFIGQLGQAQSLEPISKIPSAASSILGTLASFSTKNVLNVPQGTPPRIFCLRPRHCTQNQTLATKVFLRWALVSSEYFIYDGEQESREVKLRSNAIVNKPYHSMESHTQLAFGENSRHLGAGVGLNVEITPYGTTQVSASETDNILTFANLMAQKMSFSGGVKYLDFSLAIEFFKLEWPIDQAIKLGLEDLRVEDDYFSFSCGKIEIPKIVFFRLKIGKRRGPFSYETLLDRRLKSGEYEISPFGSNRSLVMVDLSTLLDEIDRDAKYEFSIYVEIKKGSHYLLTSGQAILEGVSRSASIKSPLLE